MKAHVAEILLCIVAVLLLRGYVRHSFPRHLSLDLGDHSLTSRARPCRYWASPSPYEDVIRDSSLRYQVDPKLVRAIICVESAFNPRALSSKGAMGLMQLEPGTARLLSVRDPYDARQNIQGGVTHLRHLLDTFEGDVNLSLAAYNAGEGAVIRARGVPPFDETREYVRQVGALYNSTPQPVSPRRLAP